VIAARVKTRYSKINSKTKNHMLKFTEEDAALFGDDLGIKWDKFDVEQFRKGMNVELEHGKRNPHTNVTDDDGNMIGKIALANLNEFPDYYDRLEKMEKEADAFWGKGE
jgi:hypothetical protein